jgi:hypothetical protein
MLLEVFLELSPDEFIISKKPILANRLWEFFCGKVADEKTVLILELIFTTL